MLLGILAGRKPDKPLELLVDGDLLALVQKLTDARGPGTTAVSKVKGHADECLVRGGRVREMDKVGNDMADQAADLGRRRGGADVIDARRNFSNACKYWYPVIRDLHRFFIAIARAVVNEDGRGGVAPDPMVWSAGSRLKRRGLLRLLETTLCCLVHRVYGLGVGSSGQILISLVMMLDVGLSLLVLW